MQDRRAFSVHDVGNALAAGAWANAGDKRAEQCLFRDHLLLVHALGADEAPWGPGVFHDLRAELLGQQAGELAVALKDQVVRHRLVSEMRYQRDGAERKHGRNQRPGKDLGA